MPKPHLLMQSKPHIQVALRRVGETGQPGANPEPIPIYDTNTTPHNKLLLAACRWATSHRPVQGRASIALLIANHKSQLAPRYPRAVPAHPRRDYDGRAPPRNTRAHTVIQGHGMGAASVAPLASIFAPPRPVMPHGNGHRRLEQAARLAKGAMQTRLRRP